MIFRYQILTFIAVYLVIMLADWMQGTHMYTLYLSYGVNISALFLTGFLSGAIFAPFFSIHAAASSITCRMRSSPWTSSQGREVV